MLRLEIFTFNPFQENTYVISNDNSEAIIVDPGCYDRTEEEELKDYINRENLKVVQLINTHCHIDHIFGNYWVEKTFGQKPWIHKADIPVLSRAGDAAHIYNLNLQPSPEPVGYLEEGDKVFIGSEALDVIFVPGHCPGHIALINHQEKWVIGGDVLFFGSIGRTDLPGGNHETLLNSIREKLFTLPDEYEVYPGHGPKTNIGWEKRNNPFFR